MKQNVQTDTVSRQGALDRPVRAQHPASPEVESESGLAQLAAMMNSGARMQPPAQMKGAIDQGPHVQRLMGLAAVINAGPDGVSGAPKPRYGGPAAQLQAVETSVVQLVLDPVALKALVATAAPALEDNGAMSPPRCVKQAYTQHDAVPGDAENAWMGQCLTRAVNKLMDLDARVRQALAANGSFAMHVSEMAQRVWTAPIAGAFVESLLARIRPDDLDGEQIAEAIQVSEVLPETKWKTDEFLTLAEVQVAARSSPNLETAYGAHESYVDLVRIRALHAGFHPPADLEIAATPTAGARRAHFNADATGYGLPRTTPELEQVIVGLGEAGEALRAQHLEQREQSRAAFKKDEVVFVPVGNVANADGEIEVKYSRSSSYVPLARLTLDAAPQAGNLNPGNLAPLFPPAGPSPAHVGQQALGDCYFLAALASIAHSKPAIIRDVVKSLGGGNYAVRFFRKQAMAGKPPSFKPEWVAVNSEVYVDADGRPVYAKGNTALWPAIVEKAYAVWKGRGSYEGISGGFSNDAFEQVLGVSAEKTDVGALHTVEGALGTGTYSPTALDLFNKIRRVTGAGGFVALDTKEWGTGGTGLSAGENTTEIAGLASSHAYSVFGTRGEPGRDKYLYVTVRNPWGHFGRGYELTGFLSKSLRAFEAGAGTFDLELSDLMRYASNLHFA